MVEFFQNIGTWFVDNKDNIVVILALIGFVALLVVGVFLVKQLRATKAGNAIIAKLSEPLSFISTLSGAVSKVSKSSNASLTSTEALNTKVTDLETKMDESFDAIDEKLNAILDVQSIVYSGIKDETARKNVANLLTSARLVATSTKAELLRQLEELKAAMATVNDAKDVVTETVAQTVDKVKKTTVKKTNVSRY